MRSSRIGALFSFITARQCADYLHAVDGGTGSQHFGQPATLLTTTAANELIVVYLSGAAARLRPLLSRNIEV